MLPGTPVTDVAPATRLITINLPDGEKLHSTHTCKLAVLWLPNNAKTAHIIPGLAHASLISIKVLCNVGCKVIYNGDDCRVYFQYKVVW